MEAIKVTIFGVRLPVKHAKGSCRLCGCTERRACAGGCAWYDKPGGICSVCAARVLTILEPPKREQELVWNALLLQTNRNILAVARWHATGDWRRAMIAKRAGQLLRKEKHG